MCQLVNVGVQVLCGELIGFQYPWINNLEDYVQQPTQPIRQSLLIQVGRADAHVR